ncbi:hypothetical protein [Streptomyces fructofermentans]|uniref:Uncharacterized protein n=1 Tax=Streptomyces fructofermentans TaxID=152141 RepID=A0A918U6F0_9ACTN|nr:hypothetical protein [Streptomyces fructofermentans]GGX99211.1 hypothetical protein GCM10010515_76750 [Streptomyces fructofermentans]
MLLLAICLAGLTPGLATAWYIRHCGRSWTLAALAGAAVVLALPATLLVGLAMVPALAYALAVVTALLALQAYDDDRIWMGAAWAVATAVALGCAGWSW